MGNETGSAVIEVVGMFESGDVKIYAGDTVDVNLSVAPEKRAAARLCVGLPPVGGPTISLPVPAAHLRHMTYVISRERAFR